MSRKLNGKTYKKHRLVAEIEDSYAIQDTSDVGRPWEYLVNVCPISKYDFNKIIGIKVNVVKEKEIIFQKAHSKSKL